MPGKGAPIFFRNGFVCSGAFFILWSLMQRRAPSPSTSMYTRFGYTIASTIALHAMLHLSWCLFHPGHMPRTNMARCRNILRNYDNTHRSVSVANNTHTCFPSYMYMHLFCHHTSPSVYIRPPTRPIYNVANGQRIETRHPPWTLHIEDISSYFEQKNIEGKAEKKTTGTRI